METIDYPGMYSNTSIQSLDILLTFSDVRTIAFYVLFHFVILNIYL